MRKLAILMIFLFVFPVLSALRINEVEINPLEGRDGTEWVEIYNDGAESVNISGFMIYDGLSSEKKRYTFSNDSVIGPDSYIIAEFSRAVLNNGGEYVILYDSENNEIDRTDEFVESSSTVDTWQYCEDGWTFSEETKGSENNCLEEEEVPEENNETEEDQEEENESDSNGESEEDNETDEEEFEFVVYTPEESQEDQDNKKEDVSTIKLESKALNSEEDSFELDKMLPMIGLFTFLLLIVLLMLLRQLRYKKNEFG